MLMAKKEQKAFTIVELLIVIVVVGILAAVTIVAYNGIQQRARVSAASSALTQSAKKLAAYLVDNSVYPADLASLNITDTSDVSYQYSYNNTASPRTFCITATSGNVSYKIDHASTPQSGGCAGHGVGGTPAVVNLARNPFIRGANTTGWTGFNPSGGSAFSISPNTNGSKGAWRLTAGAPGIGANTTVGYEYQGTGITVTPGTTVYPTIYVQSSKAGTFNVWYSFYQNTTGVGAGNGTNVAVSANAWVRLTTSAGVTVPPTADRMTIRAQYMSGATWTTGDWMESTMVSTAPGAYADGDSTDWVWNGALNASTSTGPAQ